jgi:hypothetical protein
VLGLRGEVCLGNQFFLPPYQPLSGSDYIPYEVLAEQDSLGAVAMDVKSYRKGNLLDAA